MADLDENYVPLRYNYRLETGTVGTDDENIANILYDINRMEMKSTFETEDKAEAGKALGEVFSMLTDMKVHLERFTTVAGENLDKEVLQQVTTAFDKATTVVLQVIMSEDDAQMLCKALHLVYKNMLDVVPLLLKLDAQTVG